ncbi:MAG: hypothetical protein ABSE69_10015 [Roseiarcus sp.]|jgi:hypothetical protein
MTIGTLFTADFLNEGLPSSPVWSGDKALAAGDADAQARSETIVRNARRG